MIVKIRADVELRVAIRGKYSAMELFVVSLFEHATKKSNHFTSTGMIPILLPVLNHLKKMRL